MLERPGCFVLFGIAVLAFLALVANALNPSPREAQSSVVLNGADGQQNVTTDPLPSATNINTPTPDVLLTTAALTRATADGAASMVASTATQAELANNLARTATVAVWTQRAVDVQATIDKAGADEAEAKAFMAWQTVTMLPTALTETEAAKWATVAAEQTAVVEREQAQGRSKFWGGLASEVWGALQVAVPALMILFLIVVAFLGANAFIKNLEAPTWVRKAQALSISGASTIPGRVGSKPRELVRDADRAALIAFVRQCRSKSGDGSTTITPQSQFGSDADWDANVKKLTAMDLVTTKPGNGGGTRIADGMTLAELEQVLIGGTE